MATPLSGNSPYATPADLLNYFDVRVVGDLAGDVGVRLDPSAIATAPRVLAQLAAASGQVEAACLVRDRYRPDDLASLAGNGRELLRWLVSTLAYCGLHVGRKPEALPADLKKSCNDYLDALREGRAIFGLVEAADASGAKVVPLAGGQTVRPTVPVTTRYGRLFGGRDCDERGRY